MPKTSIFIRTYAGDILWLNFCLTALRKYAHGFAEIVIATPDYQKVRNSVDVRGCRLKECAKLHPDDYIGQQITKLNADAFCQGADFILHVDSDCIATRNFSAAEFFSDADRKPLATYRRWEDAGTAICWRAITEAVLGFEPAYEYMPQLPIIHAAKTLREFRDYLGGKSNHGANAYLGAQPALSEFNAAGAWAHTFTPHDYDWRVAGPGDGYPRPLKQFWSRAGIDSTTEAEINRILA